MDNNNFRFVNQNENSNTATQIIDFAKGQIAKLTENSALVGYETEIAEGIIDVMKELIEAAVRIEAINSLERLNIDNPDVLRDIFNDSLFK